MCKILFNQYKSPPFSFVMIKKITTCNNHILMRQQNVRNHSNFIHHMNYKSTLELSVQKDLSNKKININRMKYKNTIELSVKIKSYQLKNRYKITSKILDGLLSSK